MASIFTKIIKGELPSYKIAENESHLAFLDIHPAARGHTLVIPKVEIDYLFDLPDTLLTDTVLFAKEVAVAIDKALNPLRTGLIVEGLEVPHAHIHLLPVYERTQDFSLGKKVDLSGDEMAEIARLISEKF